MELKLIKEQSEGSYDLHILDSLYHDKKIKSRKRNTDVRKYSFVNWTIQLWNQLPADCLGALSCKSSNFRLSFLWLSPELIS
jgi:hypothetical protein